MCDFFALFFNKLMGQCHLKAKVSGLCATKKVLLLGSFHVSMNPFVNGYTKCD